MTGQSRTFSFTIDTVQRATGVPAQLKARFYGMTVCQGSTCKPPSRQNATLSINRVVIGTIEWTDNTEAIFTGTFPDSLLRAGLDTLKVTSKSWSASDSNITQFYIDWFEVSYPRPIKAVSGSVQFTVPSPSAFDTTAYIVRGIPRDSASVYDLTSGRRILVLASYGSQAFVFSDTGSVQKTYYVVKETGKKVPQYLAGKTFSNLRVNTRGADYVLITHSLFHAQAEQLAQHRASAGRLRTAVVDVQDIYDEFNFGLLDPVAIRSFLKNAYYSWKRPSPAYVVMFGDASWDYKRLLASSIKVNYVPSFGNPPSDNALVSFDSAKNYIPYMLVGRIPVENTTEAASVVSKIINFEAVPVGDWNKSYLFITGGNDSNEKTTFNSWSNDLINRYVTTYPLGGRVFKVYKSSDAIIDGDQKDYMQGLINNGLVFVNFIGHSGGRYWGVDVGSPYNLQNTNGQLPFVSSVSCNVGAFSSPSGNVLAEDFLMADNRGAIAAWAAASIGYGSVGRVLVDKFLSAATVNYARNLGLLTTVARIYFWAVNSVTTPLVIQTLHLHPLLGDPYTQFAAPLQPDFDIASGDVVLGNQPATADSSITLNVAVRNRGLMAGRPVLVSVQDSYVNERGFYKGTSDAVPAFTIPDFVWRDSFAVTIDVKGKPGSHTITIQIDPKDSIAELRKDNNIAVNTYYVYRNVISAVRPPSMCVLAGSSPTFVATVPAGSDTTPLSYTFTIDTVSDFSSPAKVVSPAVFPGKVAATWQAPSLPSGQTYYWSSQSTGGSTQGVPVVSSFYIASPGPGADTIVWRQTRASQFRKNSFSLVSVTDTGTIMYRTDSVKLIARSLGYRANTNFDYYGFLRIRSVIATGYWWADANSYVVGRFDPTSGAYKLKGYDLLTGGEVDSMTAFLNQTPVGNIVMLSAVQNAKQNVTDSLYKLIEQLGSTSIRSVQAGQSWLLISRKGDGHAIIEDYKPTGIAYDSIVMPSVYSSGKGSMLSQPIGPASRWLNGSWNAVTPTGNALATLKVLGLKNDGRPDTLMTVSNSVSQIDLSGISSKTYPRLQLYARLSNLDGSTTPVLKQWDVTYLPTSELAVSAWSFAVTPTMPAPGDSMHLSLDVFNIGYEPADSVRVSFYMADDTTQRVDILVDSVLVGSQRNVQTRLTASGAGYRTVVARVNPKPGTNDFLWENNVASVPVFISTTEARAHDVRVLFDGVEIRDGDYASPKPTIAIAPSTHDSSGKVDVRSLVLLIDKKQMESASPAGQAVNGISRENLRQVSVNEALADGEHKLEVYEPLANGKSQLVRTIAFRVTAVPQLLQVYNYPNPFAHQTAFTFVVTGSQAPDEVHVKVYTVAGRMIRDIRIDAGRLQLGFNSVLWDGRDQDGDEVANGVYLYKVSMKSGDKTATAIERLAKVR